MAGPEDRELASRIVAQAVGEGYRVVAVVSAMGRRGAPYATDTLISLCSDGGLTVPAREMDLLMSCGEIISGVLFAAVLRKKGLEAVFLTGGQAGIITDDQFGDARIIKVVPGQVVTHLKEGRVVVVAGFQGVTEGGQTTTLGRGGSDTTAAALGVALGAEAVDIYTDVDGVKTADPRIVAEAQTLEQVTYAEISQLAYEGAKVIHPRAVEIARQKNIPLRVKSTFADGPGTLVTSSVNYHEGGVMYLNERPVTGITQVSHLTQIDIALKSSDPAEIARIFQSLALAGISVDFINVNRERVVFTVAGDVSARALKVLETLGVMPQVTRECAKVAVVGAGMTGRPGVMAAITEALAAEGIPILQSADSYTTIWCLVAQEHMERAVRALHRQFGLEKNLGR